MVNFDRTFKNAVWLNDMKATNIDEVDLIEYSTFPFVWWKRINITSYLYVLDERLIYMITSTKFMITRDLSQELYLL